MFSKCLIGCLLVVIVYWLSNCIFGPTVHQNAGFYINCGINRIAGLSILLGVFGTANSQTHT